MHQTRFCQGLDWWYKLVYLWQIDGLLMNCSHISAANQHMMIWNVSSSMLSIIKKPKRERTTWVEKLPHIARTLPWSSVKTPENVLPKSGEKENSILQNIIKSNMANEIRIFLPLVLFRRCRGRKRGKITAISMIPENSEPAGDQFTCVKLNYFHINGSISRTISWSNI